MFENSKSPFNVLMFLQGVFLAPETGEGTGDDNGAPAPVVPENTDEVTDGQDPKPDTQKSLLSKDDENKSEDAKGSDDDDDDVAPEPVTMEGIELPEGIEIPEDSQAPFLELMNDQSLSRTELVNKLLEMQGEALKESAQESLKAWVDIREGWRTEAKALPEIGGDKFEETVAAIKTGLEAAGATDEAFAALDATGAGDNPHLIKVLHSLVQPFLEKPPVSGDPVSEKGDRASRMFSNNSK